MAHFEQIVAHYRADFSVAEPTIKIGEFYWDKIPTDQQKILEQALLSGPYNSSGARSLTQDLWKSGNYIIGELQNQQTLYPNSVYIGNSIEHEFLTGVSQIKIEPHEFRSSLLTQMPDFSVLGWDEIAELKSSPYLEPFVKKIQEIFHAGNPSNLLSDQFESTKEKLLSETRPNAPMRAITSIITTLFTPVSALTGIRDTFKEYRRQNEHGWVYFLIDANNLIKKKS